MRPKCKIAGCDRESRGRGWCSTHWARWKTHGDPMVVKVNGIDFQVKGTCSAEGCGRPNHAHNFCSMHVRRWQKHGDPNIVTPITGRPLKGENPTWAAIHKRLTRSRGPASQFTCVTCGGMAREWSYDGADPDELTGMAGRFEMRYSLNLDSYEPRCSSCHRKFDNEQRRLAGAKGERT